MWCWSVTEKRLRTRRLIAGMVKKWSITQASRNLLEESYEIMYEREGPDVSSFFTRTLLQWNVMLHRTMFLTKKCLLSTLLVRGVVRYAKLRGKRSSPFCKQAVRQTNLLRNDYIKMMLSQTKFNMFYFKIGNFPIKKYRSVRPYFLINGVFSRWIWWIFIKGTNEISLKIHWNVQWTSLDTNNLPCIVVVPIWIVFPSKEKKF